MKRIAIALVALLCAGLVRAQYMPLSKGVAYQTAAPADASCTGAGSPFPCCSEVGAGTCETCDPARSPAVFVTTSGCTWYCNGGTYAEKCPTGGGGGVPGATYITQTHDGTLSAEQALGDLATGILKNTTSTGVLSIAVAGDFPTLNQSTTGNALTATTATNLAGSGSTTNAVDLATAEVAGILPNSNTTAASANTASAIVARDVSGNFSAGTITAALSGTATTATNLVGSGSTTNAVDLGTAEVAGTLPAASVGNGLTDAQVSDTLTASILASGTVLPTGALDNATDIASSLCADGQILKRVAGAWACAADDSGGGGVSDGDKGDITISGTGSTYTIDAGTVTLAKQANVATGTVFYRKTAGTGVPEVQTLATLKTDLAFAFSDLSGSVTDAQVPNNITVDLSTLASTVTTADVAGDTTTFPVLAGSATGSLAHGTDAGLTYNATTDALTATTFVGALSGNATTASTATLASTVTTADVAGDTTTFPMLATSATGSLAQGTDAGLTYNATTDALTATTFVGALSGNATTATTATTATNLVGSGSTTNAVDLATAEVAGTLPAASVGNGLTDAQVLNNITIDLATNSTTGTTSDVAGDTTTFPMLATAATGSLGQGTDAALTYDATADALTSPNMYAQGSVHAYDSSGDGVADTVPASVSAIIQAYTHAMIYSPLPDLYLEGGIVDTWVDIAHNKGVINLSQAAEFQQVANCAPSGCASATQTLCTGTTGTPAASSFAVGDAFLVGNLRTHIVQTVGNGPGGGGTNCPVGTNNFITFSPALLTDEALGTNGTIYSLWHNSSHLSVAGFNLLGYKIGTAPLARDGKHGPDVLTNGGADFGTPLKDWEMVGSATVTANSWQATESASAAFDCSEGTLWGNGSGLTSCFYFTGGGATDILRTPKYPRAIDVRPGERWILSGIATLQTGSDFTVSLEADINRDGTMETYVPINSLTTAAPNKTTPGWFWGTFTIPAGVHQVRIRFTRTGTNTLQVDGFSFRRAALLKDDTDLSAPQNYLINDPGSRNIVITGDSWAALGGSPDRGGAVKTGLVAGLLATTGRTLTSQIIVSGKSGITLGNFLTGNACNPGSTPPSGSGGSTNCWYDSVEQYHPLYVIVMLGTNDVFAGSPPTTSAFVANIQKLRARIRSIGAIPIIVGVAPVGGTIGTGSQYDIAHNYADAERKEILDSGFGATSIASGLENTSQTSVSSAPIITTPIGTGTVTLNSDWDTAAEINAATSDTDFLTIDGTSQTISASKAVSQGSGITLTLNKTANSGTGDRILIGQNNGTARWFLGHGGTASRHLFSALASDGTTERTYVDGLGQLFGYDSVSTGAVPNLASTGAAATWTGAHTFNSTVTLGSGGTLGAELHAALYGDPSYYILPAVVDIWTDIFLGRPTMQTNAAYSDGTVRQTLACPGGFCSGQTGSICMGAYSGGSYNALAVGDVFYLGKIGVDGTPTGNSPSGTATKTHVVVTDVGTCTGGHEYTVYPWIDYGVEPHTAGDPISPVWRHEYHPTDGAAYLIGYKLGSDSRDTWGSQGHNLVRNPGFQGNTLGAVDGWSTTVGTLDKKSMDKGSGTTAPGFASINCRTGEGYGTNDCVQLNGTDTDLIQTTAIPVRPGEQYIINLLVQEQYNCSYYGLADDRDGDGTWVLSTDMKVTISDSTAKTHNYYMPRWTTSAINIPDGVTSVKFLYHACDGGNQDWIDYVAVRKQTSTADSTVATNYLINDPGTRNVVFMGDSWLDATNPYGTYVQAGLTDALSARSITLSAGTSGVGCTASTVPWACCTGSGTGTCQAILAGHGGDTTTAILAALPTVLSTYKPLYIIFDGGINDMVGASSGSTPAATSATALANFRQMAKLSMRAGAIPIFLSMSPITTIGEARGGSWTQYGSVSSYWGAHTLREALRNWQQGADVATTQSAAPQSEYANYCPVVASGGTITAPDCKYLVLSGSTTVNTINTCEAENRGREIKILCASYTGTIVDGSNLKLAADFVCSADGVLSLACDGTNWYEVSRGAITSDTAYASSWNAVTTIPPSKNAVYDQLHIGDPDDDGLIEKIDTTTNGFVKTTTSNGTLSVDTTAYAPIDSPTFTTAASSVTPAFADNDTSVATTAFVTGAGPTFATVSGSNATTTGQSLVGVTGLSIALTTGRTYEYEAMLTVQTSAVTTGTEYGVNYSSTASLIEGALVCTLASATPTDRVERISVLHTASNPCMTTSASTVGAVFIKGIITTTGSGNLTIEHLKVTSGTSTVNVGSYLKVTRIL